MTRDDEAHTLRFHELLGAYSVIAPSRALVTAGPDHASGLPILTGPCPFCPGNDAEERVLANVPAEGPWRARVVRNKYPALVDAPSRVVLPEGGSSAEAVGSHELVIESREHDADFATYDEEHAFRVLALFRDRVAALEAMPGTAYVSLFRNRGRRSGASQPHPHSQLVASSEGGAESVVRWERALGHHTATGRSLLDDLLGRELSLALRVVEADSDSIALVPFAPQRTRECYVVPRRARGSLSSADDAALRSLARMLPRTIRRVLRASGRTDYNLLFRLPPARHRTHDAAFWYVEIVPRGATFAGFELVGMPLVAETPERSAELFRATDPDANAE